MQIKDKLLYLEEVLGVKSFLQDKLPSTQDQGPRVCFVFEEKNKDLRPEALELFAKMIQAMKLKPNDYNSEYFPLHEGTVSSCIVSFVPKSLEALQKVVSKNTFIIETEGPEVLIKNPILKKKVWLDLQKAMKFLKEEFAAEQMNN